MVMLSRKVDRKRRLNIKSFNCSMSCTKTLWKRKYFPHNWNGWDLHFILFRSVVMAIISSTATQTAWKMASMGWVFFSLRKSSHFRHSAICWHTKSIHLQNFNFKLCTAHSPAHSDKNISARTCLITVRSVSNTLHGCHLLLDIPIDWENARNPHSLEKVDSKTISIQKIPVHVCYSLLNKDLMSDRCHLRRTFARTFALALI